MKHALLWVCLLAWSAVGGAQWRFQAPIDLTAADAQPHFHHLDGAGRRHVAAAGGAVAVAWEDDHSGQPQVYLAVMPAAAGHFGLRYQLSEGEEAYEPAVVTAGPAVWLAAWEQDGSILARLVDEQGMGPVTTLAKGARQVTLAAADAGRLAVAWAKSSPQGQQVQVARLQRDGRQVGLASEAIAVAPVERPFQGYPSIAWTSNGDLVIAWEDRRAGHTRLFHRVQDAKGGFTAERQLNEHNAPPPGEIAEAGLGSGVMRVALAATDTDVRAIWLDKRNPGSGYAVWGAVSRDGGRRFGTNAIVQDEQGSAVAQWHASLAAGDGLYVAAWDDAREGWGDDSEPGDVILSWYEDGAWSPDLVVPVASGEGYQGSPAVALDESGTLHLVWIARADLQGPTRLYYARARREAE